MRQSRLLVGFFLAICSPAYADSLLNLTVENDLVAGTDRNYSSGVLLSWVSALNKGPNGLDRFGRRVPGVTDDDDLHMSLSLGHEIYTPTNIQASEFLADDRPYAAYAYLATGFTSVRDEALQTFRLSLGVIGPTAKGEWVQNTVHDFIGVDEANGWEHELSDEWVVSFAYEKRWRERWPLLEKREGQIYNLHVEAMPHVGVEIGTLANLARAGMTFRIGQGLDADYGPPRIRPSLPSAAFYSKPDSPSWYAFVGADVRWVLTNVFLDGNNFRSSHSVDKENFVSDIQAGLVWNHSRFRLAYTYVLRSREFRGQKDSDRFGSLVLTLHL